MQDENLYELLQVSETADAEIIQAAYHRLIRRNLPDRSSDPDATEITQRLNNAYAILSDPSHRAEYDRQLNSMSSRTSRRSGQTSRSESTSRPDPSPSPSSTSRAKPDYESIRLGSNYVGFLPRVSAAIIDVVTQLVSGIILAFVSVPALFALIFAGYHAIFTYYWDQTPGKMILRIQAVDTNGQKPTLKQIILREVIGKYIVFLVLLIGFIWVIKDPNKRGWHDYIGGTYVVTKDSG